MLVLKGESIYMQPLQDYSEMFIRGKNLSNRIPLTLNEAAERKGT